MYNVKLEKFEGPLDLLLELIENEKLNITELSLSVVADQYLEHIRSNDSINLENLSEFISVASKLILIKSRALLPVLKFSEEEEEEIKDLTVRLEEYKKFKEASQKIQILLEKDHHSFSRSGFEGVGAMFYPPEKINSFDLKKNFLSVLTEIPIIEKLQEEMVREVITLEEKITHLENVLRKKLESSFQEIVQGAKDKVEIIVSFLAVLEMVKQRLIQVEQLNLFCDIRLKKMD